MATNYHDSGTHTLTQLAAFNTITRQASDGDILAPEALERLRRLDALARARAEGMDIRVVTLEEAAQALWEERE